MEKISETIGVPVSKVYGVVTFYSQFTTEPKGKHVIAVCLGTACYVNGSQTILDLLCEMTGCEVNSTSPDGLFSIDATRCVGACGLAPVVSVDGIVFGCTKQLEDLKNACLRLFERRSPMLVKEIVDILKAKEIYIDDQAIYQKDYKKGFSSDLMSDALALLKNETEEVLFITGLANVQSLRTAEVLDIDTILFVRGKPLDMTIVDMAKNHSY